MVDVQAATQMTDESGQSYPFTINTLLDNAAVRRYYGAFTANMHKRLPNSGCDAIVAGEGAVGSGGSPAHAEMAGRTQQLQLRVTSWDGATLSFYVIGGVDRRARCCRPWPAAST
jgi:hypothetical protein